MGMGCPQTEDLWFIPDRPCSAVCDRPHQGHPPQERQRYHYRTKPRSAVQALPEALRASGLPRSGSTTWGITQHPRCMPMEFRIATLKPSADGSQAALSLKEFMKMSSMKSVPGLRKPLRRRTVLSCDFVWYFVWYFPHLDATFKHLIALIKLSKSPETRIPTQFPDLYHSLSVYTMMSIF